MPKKGKERSLPVSHRPSRGCKGVDPVFYPHGPSRPESSRFGHGQDRQHDSGGPQPGQTPTGLSSRSPRGQDVIDQNHRVPVQVRAPLGSSDSESSPSLCAPSDSLVSPQSDLPSATTLTQKTPITAPQTTGNRSGDECGMINPPDEPSKQGHGNRNHNGPTGIQEASRHHPIFQAKGEHSPQWASHFPVPAVLQAADQRPQFPPMVAEPNHPVEYRTSAAACTASRFIMPPVTPCTAPRAPLQNTIGEYRFFVDRRSGPAEPSFKE